MATNTQTDPLTVYTIHTDAFDDGRRTTNTDVAQRGGRARLRGEATDD